MLSVARAVVTTPLAEELVFRGALYGWLRQWWPDRTTIAGTAAAFPGIHGFLVVMPSTTHVLNNAMLVATTLLLTG